MFIEHAPVWHITPRAGGTAARAKLGLLIVSSPQMVLQAVPLARSSAVLEKPCLLELLWLALPLIWRWYHCSKHFWNCPLGIFF